MAASPNKRLNLAHVDTSSQNVQPSESPGKRIRRFQSHSQLSSHKNNNANRGTLGLKHSQERLVQNPITLERHPRPRANSDAPAVVTAEKMRSRKTGYPTGLSNNSHTSLQHQNHRASNGSSNYNLSNSHTRKSSLEMTLRDGPPPGTMPSASLHLLRHSVLTGGVSATKEGMSDYRIYLWLTLLNVGPNSTDTYLSQIHRGRSPVHAKISNDVFRTLATDTLFKRRVTDASMTRLLNATAWRITDTHRSLPSDSPTLQSPYLQGLNVLCAPLLYVSRSECQAYALLTALLTNHIPTYFTPTMSGVHAAVELIDKILATISPSLSQFLLSNSLPAKIYAFAPALTLFACTPPLPEVLKLWDFLFAFGVHLNVLCIVAQLILLKDQLMSSPSPGKMLRNLPSLTASEIIKMTLVIVRELPEDIYAEVVRHGRF